MPKPEELPQLPEVVFHAIATAIQKLIYIVERECEIAPIDLLTLWYVDYFGAVGETGQNVLLRRNLTQVLTLKFRLSEADITKMLDELQDKGLVQRTNISREERRKLFGSEHGPKLVVILTKAGSQKFDLFKERIMLRYERWLGTLSRPTRTAVRRVAVPIAIQSARWLVKRYDPITLASLSSGASPEMERPRQEH